MTAVRAILSCFGLLVLAWIFFGFIFSGAVYFGSRSIAAGIESEYEEDYDAERERRREERRAERARAEQQREGIRVDSRSARPMVDVRRR
jgi:hypothetical protein